MKRMLSIVLTIAILLSLTNTVAFASANKGLNITANSQSVKPGETTIITLTVTKNPGFGWLSITPVCDTGFAWDAQNGELPLDIDKGTKNINWSADRDCTGLGILLKLSVTVPANVEPGDYEIKFRVNECYNENLDDVSVTVSSAIITVSCPHTNTTEMPEEPAACDEGGYTAGVYCNDCETCISGHEPIPATGNHVDADGMWEADGDAHFHRCKCGYIFDRVSHSGGVATCMAKAQCKICGKEYGQVDSDNHSFSQDYSSDENAHWRTCACGSIADYAAHSYTYQVQTVPTESVTGKLIGSCKTCSGTTTVTLPKLNKTDYSYKVVTAATCTAAGTARYTWKTTTYGTFYFDVTISTIGHNYVDGNCVNCGAGETNGDFNADGYVNNEDVAYLLWYTLFPEDYPISGNADFNGDGYINNEDVAYLLWHTLFPEDYPL